MPAYIRRRPFRAYLEQLEVRRLLTSDVIGDFDESGDYSVPDIDALCAEVAGGAHDIRFDLTGDELVDQNDIEHFLSRSGSLLGDADLNGTVDFGDFLALSAGFGQEGLWSDGNFGCNEQVAFGDFLKLSQNFGQSGDIQLAEVQAVSPGDGEEMVNVTREVVIRFNSEVIPSTVNIESVYLTAGGERLDSRVVVSSTERFATVFNGAALPPSSTVRLVVDGDKIVDRSGRLLDADNDGELGGSLVTEFRTLPLTRIANTNVFGFVRDSMSGEPIVGATIRVDAFPEANVTTDSQGRFELQDMPAPDFFVHIDGSTATGLDEGVTYPNVGKPFHSVPGQTVQLKADGEVFDIYLPKMALSDIQSLSPNETTIIGVGDRGKSDLAALFPDTPPDVWDRLTLSVEPGAAVDDLGNASTQAAIIPVPPDRIPAPLPSFMASMASLVVSIQAGTATNFDIPAEVTFPNLDNLPAGARVPIMSFNHDAGAWKHAATGIVSDNGEVIETEPGTGISAPGWHLAPPGGKKGDQSKDPECGFTCVLKKIVKDAHSDAPSDSRTDVMGKRGAAMAHRFDFGSDVSPLAEDYERVTPFTVFDEEQGFGWTEGEIVGIDRGSSDASNELTQDFVETQDAHFAVTLDNGIYEVSVTIGDVSQRRVQTGIYLEGSLATNATVDAGDFFTATQIIAVEDGQLDVDVIGLANKLAAINSLTVTFESELPGESLDADGIKHFALQEIGSDFVVRGTFGSQSEFVEEMLFSQDTDYELSVFSPDSLVYGVARFRTSGLFEADDRIPFPTLAISEGPDQDEDGLLDTIEFVLGTALNSADTDDDGINDLAEVQQGLNPLDDLAFPTGIVGRLPSDGGGIAIDVAGNPFGDMTAYLGSSTGLELIDVTQFDTPISLAKVNVPGGVVDVAVDTLRDLAVVASNSSHSIIDVSDPLQPSVISTSKRDASDVELLDGHGYLADDKRLTSIDLSSAEVLLELDLETPINKMVRDGNHLYLLQPGALQIVEIFGPTMLPKGSVELGANGTDVVVGDGVAYITVASAGGYMTVDVSNPSEPFVIAQSQTDGPQPGGTLALNGSGSAVLAGFNLAAKVFDISDSSQTDRILAPFEVSNVIRDVAIAGGIAFLAPSRGSGLTVLNYAPFDVNGQAPTVSVDATSLDLDSEKQGIQVTAGSLHTLRPVVTDDVQVYSVDLLLNGELVSRDISYPFELPFETPVDAVDETIGIQVQVTDTGGNTATSPIAALNVVADTIPPEVVGVSPADGDVQVVGLKSVALIFSEPVDATRLTLDSISLTAPDGSRIKPVFGGIHTESRIVRFSFEPLNAPGRYHVLIDSESITDVVGNPIVSGAMDHSFELVEGTIFWTSPQDGFWDDPTNWDLGRVPDEDDIVSINSPEDITVTIRQSTAVRAIRTTEHLLLTSNLRLDQSSLFEGGLTIEGGNLHPLADLELSGESHFIRGVIRAEDELTNTGALTLSGNSTKDLNGSFNNSGTIRYSGDNWRLNGLFEAVLINEPGASFEIIGEGGLSVFRNSGDTRIENYGEVKVSNEGIAHISAKFRNLGGSVSVSQGELNINSPTSVINGGILNTAEGSTLNVSGILSGEILGDAAGQIGLNNVIVDEGDKAVLNLTSVCRLRLWAFNARLKCKKIP